jgi:hypothetical protein
VGTKLVVDIETALATVDNSALAAQAQHGDTEAMIELARRLKDDPKELIRLYHGDLANVVAGVLLTSMIHKEQPALKEGVRLRMVEIRRGLKGPNPSTLELLLIDRCVLTWLDLYTMEMQFRSNDYINKSFKYIEAMGKRLDLAERRHLRALKTLADVRRLNLPPICLDLRGQNVPKAQAPDYPIHEVIEGQAEPISRSAG